ncbi:MAG: Asp23/Gls24 family envelope stress response protein [Pseudonocardiaceae bacterium]
MPSSTTPDGADGAQTQLQLHVSETVVARVAAYHACRVPGVRRLCPDLAQSMASIATRLFPPRDGAHRMPTDGVTATVEDGRARISITLVTQWGRNCRDNADQVLDQVTEQVRGYTGLPTIVTVTIAGVDYDDWSHRRA